MEKYRMIGSISKFLHHTSSNRKICVHLTGRYVARSFSPKFGFGNFSYPQNVSLHGTLRRKENENSKK